MGEKPRAAVGLLKQLVLLPLRRLREFVEAAACFCSPTCKSSELLELCVVSAPCQICSALCLICKVAHLCVGFSELYSCAALPACVAAGLSACGFRASTRPPTRAKAAASNRQQLK